MALQNRYILMTGIYPNNSFLWNVLRCLKDADLEIYRFPAEGTALPMLTGGYVVPGFDPTINRKHFQAIADFILEKRDEYLGVKDTIAKTKLKKLQAYAQSLGIDLEQVFVETHKTNAA